VNTWVKRGVILALLVLAAVSFANPHRVNAGSSPPSGIGNGAYMWYKFLDFDTNETSYMYIEFMEVQEHTAELAIRTGLPSLNQSERSQYPPSYGYLDFESGDFVLFEGTNGVGFSFWTNPSAHMNATSGFPPDNEGYRRLDCLVVESELERSWYDKVTGVLIETIFLQGELTTAIVTLYSTSIPVGAASRSVMPFEISADTMTYAAALIGLVAAVAIATIGIRRFRKRKKIARGALARQCPSCGSKNRDDAVFCSRCGSSLAAPGAPVMKLEPPVSAASVMRPEPSVPVAPFMKAEPGAPAATPRQEWVRVTSSPVEARNVCRTCGHVNPDWNTVYCVRCAARLRVD
jgi:hypothetical protein